ncbi:MAG: hypothetical protein EOP48_00960 [Sphingobacteriales bacterium]|nr:MAG: hypothetical protein EOP48_00960 [Sphingobacteriales bacterium]
MKMIFNRHALFNLPFFSLYTVFSLTVCTTNANSEEKINISGFGTLGYSQLLNSSGGESFDSNSLSYKSNKTKKYMGIDKRGTFARDARFGLNLDIPLDKNNLFLTAQIYSEAADTITGESQEFKTRLSLLNLNYSPFDGTTIRAGLLRIPIWFISDEKLVGYTYPFIRNPTEVDTAHRQGDTVTGVSISKVFEFGKLAIRPTVTGGSIDFHVADNYRDRTTALGTGLFASTRFEYGENIIMSLGYTGVKANSITDTVRETEMYGYDILSTQVMKNDVNLKEYVADFKYESSKFLMMSEVYTQVYNVKDSNVKPINGGRFDVTGGYILVGLPIKKWLPRLSASQHRSKLNIGLNYQWKTNVLFKMELQRTMSPSEASVGLLGLNRGGTIDLLSTSVDFVY